MKKLFRFLVVLDVLVITTLIVASFTLGYYYAKYSAFGLEEGYYRVSPKEVSPL